MFIYTHHATITTTLSRTFIHPCLIQPEQFSLSFASLVEYCGKSVDCFQVNPSDTITSSFISPTVWGPLPRPWCVERWCEVITWLCAHRCVHEVSPGHVGPVCPVPAPSPVSGCTRSTRDIEVNPRLCQPNVSLSVSLYVFIYIQSMLLPFYHDWYWTFLLTILSEFPQWKYHMQH